MISILITSYKRANLLKWGLESCTKYEIKPEYEIIVLDEGKGDDGTREVCDEYSEKLNIRYIFTHNDKNWRVPGFPINIGLKQCYGEKVVIGCAEMYHVNDVINIIDASLDVNERGLIKSIDGKMKDDTGVFLDSLNKDGYIDEEFFNKYTRNLNNAMPFFMGLHKKEIVDIGGYDEDFTGVAFDDDDIMSRLRKNGCPEIYEDMKLIHLFHPRGSGRGWRHNRRIYERKYGQIIRNADREWGILKD